MKLTQSDKKEVIEAMQLGKTTKELAITYGISSVRIGQIYREETGKRVVRRRAEKLSQRDKEEIVAELQAKEVTIQELATRYDVTPQTIGRHFKKMVGKAFLPRSLQIDQETFVQELQSGKVKVKDLAKRYGVHKDAISRKFKQVTGTALHPRKLSQAERDQIVTAIQEGKTTTELSIAYGVHSTYIGQIFKQATGRVLPRRNKLTPHDREAIVEAIQSGKTPKELAAQFGVSSGHIGHVYKQVTGSVSRPRQKLSQTEKEAIIAAIQSKQATMTELAGRYHITQAYISYLFKKSTGNALRPQKAVQMPSRYRAWHKRERKMYEVWGIDWLHEKILIQVNGSEEWQSISTFTLMQSSGLKDRKHTLEYPQGQEIWTGDIIQFSINLEGKETEVKDVVAVDRGWGGFVLAALDEGTPVEMYNEECEVIGNILTQPELLGSELQIMRKLLKEYSLYV